MLYVSCCNTPGQVKNRVSDECPTDRNTDITDITVDVLIIGIRPADVPLLSSGGIDNMGINHYRRLANAPLMSPISCHTPGPRHALAQSRGSEEVTSTLNRCGPLGFALLTAISGEGASEVEAVSAELGVPISAYMICPHQRCRYP